MTADAVVVQVRSDLSVDLEFTPRPCAGCAGTCLWKRIRTSRLERVRVDRDLEPLSEVTVSLAGGSVLLAALLLYGVPLAAILIGAAAGAAIAGSDAGTLLGALAGLALAAVASRQLGRRLERLTLSRLSVAPKP